MDREQKELQKLKLQELKPEFPETYKKICCPSCDHEVQADQININDKIAKCTNCNGVFSFEEELQAIKSPKVAKQEVLRPEGINIFEYQGELELTIQQPLHAIDIIPLVFLPMFAFIFTGIFFSEGISIWFPLASWALVFYFIVNIINRSKHKIFIHIDDAYVSIQHRPRKFNKDKKFRINEIDQIYTKKYASSNYYAVYMILNGLDGQKHVKLIPYISSGSKARYIEQEIEAHLGIEDRQVPEES